MHHNLKASDSFKYHYWLIVIDTINRNAVK